jgi:hypothetical protein
MKRTFSLLSIFLFISFPLAQTQIGTYIEDEEENLWKPSSLPGSHNELEIIHDSQNHPALGHVSIQNSGHRTTRTVTQLFWEDFSDNEIPTDWEMELNWQVGSVGYDGHVVGDPSPGAFFIGPHP